MFTICLERGGNGNPLQYSCLENPRDKGAWWATVRGVTKGWTLLKWLRMFACQFHIHVSITLPPTTWETKYTETIARPYTTLKSQPYDICDSDPQLPGTSPRIQTTTAVTICPEQSEFAPQISGSLLFAPASSSEPTKENQICFLMQLQKVLTSSFLTITITSHHYWHSTFFHSKGLPLPCLPLCLPNANGGGWLSHYSKLRINNLFVLICNPMDCSPPGSSVHGILQARIPEWVAIPFPRGSSQPRDRTQASCIGGRFFTIWVMMEAPIQSEMELKLKFLFLHTNFPECRNYINSPHSLANWHYGYCTNYY